MARGKKQHAMKPTTSAPMFMYWSDEYKAHIHFHGSRSIPSHERLVIRMQNGQLSNVPARDLQRSPPSTIKQEETPEEAIIEEKCTPFDSEDEADGEDEADSLQFLFSFSAGDTRRSVKSQEF